MAAVLAKEVAAVDALERSLPPVEGPRMASQVTQWVISGLSVSEQVKGVAQGALHGRFRTKLHPVS